VMVVVDGYDVADGDEVWVSRWSLMMLLMEMRIGFRDGCC